MGKSRFLRAALIMLPLLLSSLWGFAQTKKVQGTVTDESGESLIGVNVVIQGTTDGTITNMEGKYTLDAQEGATLTFTYIGYQPQEVVVDGRDVIDVVMKEDATNIGEVVVIGYGVQRKEAVTGSVASMGGEELNEVASTDVTRALQGRIAGVEFSQNSSKPGSSMQIRIRGTRSITADNDPLIVLDGIPFAGQITDINTSDIKSVDILKDASATAIYGSRGANGVILITTNQGKKGQKPQVSYNGSVGLKKVFAPYPMMNGPEFVALREAAGQFTNTLDESNDTDTDWQDLFYRTGLLTSHNVSISGGTETGSYKFGLGYDHDQAVVPEQNFSRYSLDGSLNQDIGKYFSFGVSTKTNFSVWNGINGIPYYNVLSNSPIASPYNPDGTIKRAIEMPLDQNWVATQKTIEDLGDEWIDQTKAFGSYNTMFAELKIPGIEGLKYRVQAGLSYRQSLGGNYTGTGVFNYNADYRSSASVSNSHTFKWSIENLLTYDRVFAEKHSVNLVAMYSAEENKYHRSKMTAKYLPSSSFQFYNIGRANSEEITVNPDDQWYNMSGLMSYMGRAMYSYDDKYMVTFTYRSDGSSRLADGHEWHSYPAVSVGWNLGNESFMESIEPINMLKIRAGYGQTSNQAVAPYKTLGLLEAVNYNFGDDDYATGYRVKELPNPELGWEYSETINVGLDFALFNNRLSGTFEYYTTKTKELLMGMSLPRTSGVNSITANIGETENKGFEVSLQGVILDNLNGWTWTAGVNVYANRNKLTKLADGQEENTGNWWFVGYPIDAIYDYKKVGLWQEGDPYMDVLEPDGNPGMIKVEYTGEYEADGTPSRRIGSEDRQPMSMEADFQGGFNTTVSYKGFDLGIIGAFKSGGILISTLYSANSYLNLMSGRRGNVKVDYWTPENTGAKYPAPDGIRSGDNPKYGTTLGYFDASYLKIRNISLGYTLKKDWIAKAGISNLRVYFTVQNPFVMFSPYHKESGMDPETNSKGNENQAVTLGWNRRRILTIGNSTPSTRNYLFGINLTF